MAGKTIRRLMPAALAAAALGGLPAQAQETGSNVAPQPVKVSAEQLFAIADRARTARDFVTVETAYRALTADPDVELRTQARFRLSMMLADDLGKYREAAVLLREILDEKPTAARVRIELARIQAMLGDLRAAERELRAAQAAGLPPEVEQQIRFYAAALSARKPFGGSIAIALAPDSNINRATRSDTLGTIIGEFILDEDAKARSGLGLALRADPMQRKSAAPSARISAARRVRPRRSRSTAASGQRRTRVRPLAFRPISCGNERSVPRTASLVVSDHSN